MDTRRIVGGHHTRKTAAFVRACAAYCFITVPSIGSVVSRLELYMLSGQVALLNQCLGQGKNPIIEHPVLLLASASYLLKLTIFHTEQVHIF